MKSNKNTYFTLTLVILGILLLGTPILSSLNARINQDYDNNITDVQTSWGYEVEESIEIHSLENWTHYRTNYDWCYIEDGDHYVIENCIFNGAHITITYSDMPFEVRSCLIDNPDLDGMIIQDCSNFTLSNNTINGLGSENIGINITTTNSNIDNVAIVNNTILNIEGGIGIFSESYNMSNINVINNTVKSTTTAMSFMRYPNEQYQFSNLSIRENNIENTEFGLFTYFATHANISDNIIRNCTMKQGIHLYVCPNATVSGNSLEENGTISFESYSNREWLKTVNIPNGTNTVNDLPIICLRNAQNIASKEFHNAGQIILINCAHSELDNVNVPIWGFHSTNLTISNNRVTNRYSGAHLEVCSNSTLYGNSFSNNRYGAIIKYSNNTCLYNNTFSSCSDYGVFLDTSNETTVNECSFINSSNEMQLFSALNSTIKSCAFEGGLLHIIFSSNYTVVDNCIFNDTEIVTGSGNGTYINNTAFNNERFIHISGDNNLFYSNYLIDNGIHAQDYGNNNRWYFSGIGNYWDDYNGTDTDGDGIGHTFTPYTTSGPDGGKDFYPLCENSPPSVTINYPLNTTYSSSLLDINTTITEITDWKLEPIASVDSVIAEIDETLNLTLDQISDEMCSYNDYEFTEGLHNIRIYANDTFGNMNATESTTFTIDLSAPTWDEPPEDQAIDQGEPLHYNLNASDAQTIIYSIDDTENFTIDSDTGVLRNATDLSFGFYPIQLNASDGTHHNLKNITITVRETSKPVWVEEPQNQTAELGEPFSYEVNATDPDSYIANYGINRSDFVISDQGVLTNNSVLDCGIYWLEIWAEDPFGNNRSALIKVNVSDTKPPQWDITIEDLTLEYGESLSYNISASDPSEIDTYWDNSSLFAFNERGTLTNITALESGIYWVEIGVNDTLGHTATRTIMVTVNEAKTPPDDGGDGQPIDPTMIFVIAGVIGGLGTAGAIGGILVLRKRKARAASSRAKLPGEKDDNGYRYQSYQGD